MASICELSAVASSEHDSDNLQLETNPDEEEGLLQETEEQSSSLSQTRGPIVGVYVSRDLKSIEFTQTKAGEEKTAQDDGKQASPRADNPVRPLHLKK